MQQKTSSSSRVSRWMWLAASAAALAGPGVAQAAQEANGRVDWNGSYAQSCSNVDVDKHGRLSATCLRKDGKSNRTNLTEKECPGHRAANDDGKLVCETGSTTGGAGSGTVGQNKGDSGRWEGSFKQSCRDFSVNEDGTLSASCRTKSGSWNESSLARVNCTDNRAMNNDGHLACESQRVGMNRWEGSFEKTCRDIYMDEKGTLTATCQTANGEWNRTWLSAQNCASYTAMNKDGRLACERGGNTAGNGGSKEWDGSFKQSCRDISVSADGTLKASCQAKNGSWQQASLARVNCSDNRAKNVDGHLACESQRVSMNRWDGSFAKTCRDVYMDDKGTLTAKCQSKSGTWVPAQLTVRQCGSYRAANDDGRLVCEQQTSQRQ